MAKKKNNTIIEIVHPVCCGLDVHKKKISACLITVNEKGKEQFHIKEFGTFTDELIKMRKWMLVNQCPIVAMESTGIYWRPVHNILEGYMEVTLVNARHIKNVPGRKTDINDSKWLAGLVRHGLVKGSFIPPKQIRQWRDLTRMRKRYTESMGDYKRRVQKLFETANIKIDSVVSDLFGVTGRNLIALLCSDTEMTLDQIENSAKRSLKKKTKELYRSIKGFFEEHHRYLLIDMMEIIDGFETRIAGITERLNELTCEHQDIISRLTEIHGIDIKSAQSIISETGITLEEFKSMESFACWAGLCPGNNESGGKRKSGRSPVRNHPLKTILVEVAWSAVKKKGSYYRNKYYKLKSRRGAKKAIVAIAHRISKAIYNIIKLKESFKDLGEDYLTNNSKERVLANIKKRACQLGYQLVEIKTA